MLPRANRIYAYSPTEPTFPFLLLLYSLYSLLFWPYFSFSSAAARKVKQRHKTAFLSRFHQKVEEIHFKLEKTVKNCYSWLIRNGFSVLSRWKRISSTFREILTGKRLYLLTNKIFLLQKLANILNLGENCPIWYSSTYLKLSDGAGNDHGRTKHGFA